MSVNRRTGLRVPIVGNANKQAKARKTRPKPWSIDSCTARQYAAIGVQTGQLISAGDRRKMKIAGNLDNTVVMRAQPTVQHHFRAVNVLRPMSALLAQRIMSPLVLLANRSVHGQTEISAPSRTGVAVTLGKQTTSYLTVYTLIQPHRQPCLTPGCHLT